MPQIPVEYIRDPDLMEGKLVAAGSIPLGGDYTIEEAPERHSFESFVEGTEEFISYSDAPKVQRKRGRPRKK